MDITKFEYKTIPAVAGNWRNQPDYDKELNALGKEGWEVTGISSGGQAVLKRPSGKIQVREIPAPAQETNYER